MPKSTKESSFQKLNHNRFPFWFQVANSHENAEQEDLKQVGHTNSEPENTAVIEVLRERIA